MTTQNYSPDDLIDLLTAGAQIADRPTMKAAVHLLTFTQFPHQHDAVSLLEFDNDEDPSVPAGAAYVRDWRQVAAVALERRWGTGAEHLVALAVSLATGGPVDLRATVPSGGYAHAQRVIEAMVIATGHSTHYAITRTPELEQLIRDRDALLSGN